MSHPEMKSFVAEIPLNDPEKMALLQQMMNEYHDHMNEYAKSISQELGVSEGQADQILYLRGRSRWSQELEDRIIKAHKESGKVVITLAGEEEENLQELGY